MHVRKRAGWVWHYHVHTGLKVTRMTFFPLAIKKKRSFPIFFGVSWIPANTCELYKNKFSLPLFHTSVCVCVCVFSHTPAPQHTHIHGHISGKYEHFSCRGWSLGTVTTELGFSMHRGKLMLNMGSCWSFERLVWGKKA